MAIHTFGMNLRSFEVHFDKKNTLQDDTGLILQNCALKTLGNNEEVRLTNNTVNSLIATTSRKRPPPVSDHFVKNRFVSQSNTVPRALS